MNNLDPVNVAVLGFAALLGSQELAQVIGPYAVICILASVGAAWSVGGTKGLSLCQSLGYFLLIVITAIVSTYYLTKGLAHFFGSYLPQSESGEPASWMLGGVALFIGGVGTNWKGLGKWLMDTIKRKVKAFLGGKVS